jgi:hypothetical protein
MATPQALTDLSQKLRACADALNAYADSQADPFDPSLSQLRTTAGHIIIDAVIIGQKQLDAMSQDVTNAIAGLQNEVNAAQNAVNTINDVKKAVSIAAAVFSAAAAIASGNELGAVNQIISLATTISSAVSASANSG